MTTDDLPVFLETFRAIAHVFPLRGTNDEIHQVESLYYRCMRRFPIDDIKIGAEKCLSACGKFPKPAEWIAKIPSGTGQSESRQMTDRDAREYRHAEKLCFQDVPCSCELCHQAGVTHLPLRFVPDWDQRTDLPVKAFDASGRREVTDGHWAHGYELKRWHDARESFFQKYYAWIGVTSNKDKHKARRVFERDMKQIFTEPPRRAEVLQIGQP